MQVDPAIIDSLESIQWFNACGIESALSNENFLKQVGSWQDADDAYDEKWEKIIEQQQHLIATTLATHYQQQFNQWNMLFAVARYEVSQRVAPVVAKSIESIGLSPFYSNAICRDVQLYLMELTYAQQGCQVPIFFRNLFAIYRVGHFPCGWSGGAFPIGVLLYY